MNDIRDNMVRGIKEKTRTLETVNTEKPASSGNGRKEKGDHAKCMTHHATRRNANDTKVKMTHGKKK
jgi:hypothetical protein